MDGWDDISRVVVRALVESHDPVSGPLVARLLLWIGGSSVPTLTRLVDS